MPKPHQRSIYVVVFWQERPVLPDKPAIWRINLENARTGEQSNFATLEQLNDFFENRMREDG